MNNVRGIIIVFIVLAAMVGLFFVVRAVNTNDHSFGNFFKEYQTNGKDSRFTPDDIRKSFN